MSPNRLHQHTNTAPFAVAAGSRWRGFVRLGDCGTLLLFMLFLCVPAARAATDLNLTATATGVAITPSGVNYLSSFGTLNALGVPPAVPTTGVSIAILSNGALYFTTLNIDISGGISGAQTVNVTAYASTNFGHPAALIVDSCPSTSSCTSAANFAAMSTNVGGQTTMIPSMGKNTPTTIGLAVFVPDNNGGTAFAGSDSATITFTANINGSGTFVDSVSLSLNSPTETLQTAVQLNLATHGSGLAVTAGSDYSMTFGNVNALGIGPGAGLTTVAQAGGIIYSTPYDLLPAFSDMSSTSASISVCASMPFTHSTILVLEDSSTGAGGSFSNVSTNCGAATALTSSAGDRSTITRYLGLFVSNINGLTAYTGADTATLKYTLTVP